jgi:ankyrin repeat protein
MFGIFGDKDKKLIKAIREKEWEKAIKLIKNGAHINAKQDKTEGEASGGTVLHIILGHIWTKKTMEKPGFSELINLILSKNPDLEIKDDRGRTVIIAAIGGGTDTYDTSKKLIDRGANVNATWIEEDEEEEDSHWQGSTPLHLAAGIYCVETVKLLIEKGADINAIKRNGDTPLKSTIKAYEEDEEEDPDFEKVISILKSHGAKN